MFNLVPSVKFSPTMLIVDDVVHTVPFVCTRGLNEILGFGLDETEGRRLRERKAETESEAAMEGKAELYENDG